MLVKKSYALRYYFFSFNLPTITNKVLKMAVFGTLSASSISFGAQLANFFAEKSTFLKLGARDFYALSILLSFLVMVLCAVKVLLPEKYR